jgi:RimJ/RimL family protein N-acetyltransferase
MVPEGQTERLILRPAALTDAEQIQSIFPDWQVVQFLANRVPWPYPTDGAFHYLRDVALPLMERGESWEWTLRLRNEPDTIIGSLRLVLQDGHNRGFWLGVPWHGHGYMSEACAWANDFWSLSLSFPVLRVAKAVANTASRRISAKHGMRIVGSGEQHYVSGVQPSETWEITADEWRAWKATERMNRRTRANG